MRVLSPIESLRVMLDSWSASDLYVLFSNSKDMERPGVVLLREESFQAMMRKFDPALRLADAKIEEEGIK